MRFYGAAVVASAAAKSALSILFMRFGKNEFRMQKNIYYTFNSLYEILSLWLWCNRSTLQNFLSILFMRFHASGGSDPVSLALSILFMRFLWVRKILRERRLTFNSLYEILVGVYPNSRAHYFFFQFSLWDSSRATLV